MARSWVEDRRIVPILVVRDHLFHRLETCDTPTRFDKQSERMPISYPPPHVPDLLPGGLLRGHTAFITGGDIGINLAIAPAFAHSGASVSICGRTERKLIAAADELKALGARVRCSVSDVRDAEAVSAALARTAEELDPVTTVVAGAAGSFFAPAEKFSPKGFGP